VPLATLSVAAIAAIATGSGIGPVTGAIESLSGSSSTALGRVVSAAPVGYAIGAGMVTAFNPCGFAMLPSYLGLYLGVADGTDSRSGVGFCVLNALRIGGTVSISFVLLFGLAGIVLSLAAASVSRWLPWLALAMGVVLVFTAGRVLASVGEELAARLGARTRQVGLGGYFAYGLAYALGSLSCTLPIFLAVVGSALARNGFLAGALQFVLYALGMGLVGDVEGRIVRVAPRQFSNLTLTSRPMLSTASSSSFCRPRMKTKAPSSTNSLAVASPIPEVHPVITATLSCSVPFIDLLLDLR